MIIRSRPLPELEAFVLTIVNDYEDDRTADETVCRLAAAEASIFLLQEQIETLRNIESAKRNESPSTISAEPNNPTTRGNPHATTFTQRLRATLNTGWGRATLTCAALLLIGFAPWPHSIRCDAVCEPALRRFVCVPFESQLESVNVTPGQTVSKGQVLAILDGSELRSELAAIEAQREQSQQRQGAAIYQRDASAAEIERLEIERLEQESSRITRHQTQLEIRSPIDGVIVKGDLEGVQGAALNIGQELFEIAPLDAMIVEVAIPESEILSTTDGMGVEIYFDAFSGRAIETHLERIHPRNELRDSGSVFIANAPAKNPDRRMRPGMQGTASIHIGYRSVGWILLHKPFRTLRVALGW